MGKIGPVELVVILVLALLIFGPAKLPEIGRSIGKAVNEFKSQANKLSKDLETSIEEPEEEEEK